MGKGRKTAGGCLDRIITSFPGAAFGRMASVAFMAETL
jgi:hypothetical protein